MGDDIYKSGVIHDLVCMEEAHSSPWLSSGSPEKKRKKERKEKISSNWVEKDVGLRFPLTILQKFILVELTNVGDGKIGPQF